MLDFDTQNTAGRYVSFFLGIPTNVIKRLTIEILREKAARVAY